MLSIRHVTRKRSLFALNHAFFAAPCTSLSAALEPSAAFPRFVNRGSSGSSARALITKETASSLKDWLRAGNDHLLFTIFEILKSDKGFDRQSDKLTQLNLHLSEPFVLQVLNYGKRQDDGVLLCVRLFDWAGRQPRYHHTRAAYYAIFKILAAAKLTSKIIDFTENFISHKYSLKVRFYDTLVIGYALAGKPEVALGLFSRMRFQGIDLDEFGYHVLLNALVEENCFDAVQVIAKQISSRGLCNSVTHSIMLKSLFKQNQLQEAGEYLRGLVREGEGKGLNPNVLGGFVHALCSGKRFQEAASLVEEFRELKVVPMDYVYGIYLRDLVQDKQLDRALDFLQTMKCLEGYIPDVSRYNILILRLLKVNWLKDVRDLLLEMKENQVSPDRWTVNVALCLFCKVGMVEDALELYNSRSEFKWSPTNIASDCLIRMLCKYDRADEAFGILKSSIKQGCYPSKWAFDVLVNALCCEGKLDAMKEVLDIAAQKPNWMLCSSSCYKVISALCKAERVEEGHNVLVKLNEGNNRVVWSCYSNLIRGYTSSEKLENAVMLLLEARQKNYRVPLYLYRDVIRELCKRENPQRFLEQLVSSLKAKHQVYSFFIDGAGRAQKPGLAVGIYNKSIEDKEVVRPTKATYILLLHSHLKSNKVAKAMKLFDDLHQKGEINKRLYYTMVVGLCKAEKLEYALEYFGRMRKEDIVPNLECSEVLVNELCFKKFYKTAVDIVTNMLRDGRQVSTFIGNTLLSHSSKTQEIYDAWDRHGEQEGGMSVGLLGNLLGVFCGRERWMGDSFESLEEEIGRCFQPDLFTCNLVLRQLTIRDIDLARRYFNRLSRREYEPNRWTVRILIEGLRNRGRIGEVRWLEKKYGKEWIYPNKNE